MTGIEQSALYRYFHLLTRLSDRAMNAISRHWDLWFKLVEFHVSCQLGLEAAKIRTRSYSMSASLGALDSRGQAAGTGPCRLVRTYQGTSAQMGGR